jgi:hypothetical protein
VCTDDGKVVAGVSLSGFIVTRIRKAAEITKCPGGAGDAHENKRPAVPAFDL